MVQLVMPRIYLLFILIMDLNCAPLTADPSSYSSSALPLKPISTPLNYRHSRSGTVNRFQSDSPSPIPSTTPRKRTELNPFHDYLKLSKCPKNRLPSNRGNDSRLTVIDQHQNFVPEEMLIRLSTIRNSKQLMDYLTEDNHQQPFNTSKDQAKSRRKARNIVRVDHFSGSCSPENQTQVIKPTQGRSDIYFPGCIKVPRCSGCCPSDRLTCQPIDRSNISIEVMILRYIPHSRRFKYAGRERFYFERHDSCECKCIQDEVDCTSVQMYKREECRCVCRDLSQVAACTSNPNKYWDSADCSCKCSHPHNCSSGLQFNQQTCSCDTSLDNGALMNYPNHESGEDRRDNKVNSIQLNGNRSISTPIKWSKSSTTTTTTPRITSFWDYPDTVNLLTGNVPDDEFNEMNKVHRSLGFQGINPGSSSLSSSALPSY